MSSSPASELSDDDSTIKAASETTPLLATAATGPIAEPIEGPAWDGGPQDDSDDDKPLPLGQIFLLCFTRLVEPISFFSIFPFINKMIWETGGVAKADVGFYSGLIESLFSATQMCVMIGWGRAADRFGRKPVLVISLCGVAVATALFGMSKTLWQMIIFRCLAGVFAGTIVTVRTMITENSTQKTQARAFSYFAFIGNMGIFIGPFIGGSLESPAHQYPSVFGRIQFLKDYPYALPTFVTGAIGAVAAIVSALFIKETLNHKDSKSSSGPPPMSTWEIIKSPGVLIVLGLSSHVMLLAFAYTAVVPVFLFTDIDLGGMGFSPIQISAVMAVAGLSQALWLLLIFPPLQHRIGTGGVLRACGYVWPLFFLACPLCNIFLRNHVIVLFWIVGSTALLIGSGVAMAFTGVQLALNDVSPSHETLGTLNALALVLSSGIRAVAPAVSTAVFAIGVRGKIFGGHLFWIVLISIAAAVNVNIRFLPAQAQGGFKKPSADSES
ncbi:MFS transporter [Lepidopterella palustris CBS 459.81]|uniref:MFS transporter n=1 Tax=Lepidopterella palustris CBS 459.81 TaxID=1314670 RepID=A0A8E2JK13_9PEZI|nr:MFS transporter [Lepidopterella palustris CBS 459.81]